jgi:hypothetical protein
MTARPAARSDGLNKAAPISAQGMRNISTPEPVPKALVLTIPLAIPVIGSMRRPIIE